MKKITAYEVGGEIYKNKKEAEKAEVEHKKTLEKTKLIAELHNVCKKLGIAMPPCPDFGKRLTCVTGEHKILTDKGWQEAKDLPALNPEGGFKTGEMVVITSKPEFKEGDRVSIIGGDFLGQNGVVNDLAAPDYYWVGIEGQPRNIKIHQVCLEKMKTEKPKFKKGDKVKALESCVCADHRGCVGKIARVDSVVSPFSGRSYAVQFGSVPRLKRFGTKTSGCVIPEKDLELVGQTRKRRPYLQRMGG